MASHANGRGAPFKPLALREAKGKGVHPGGIGLKAISYTKIVADVYCGITWLCRGPTVKLPFET